MKNRATKHPSKEEISTYGNFSVLFIELTTFLYNSFNSCRDAENGAHQELRRIRRLRVLYLTGFVLMPVVVMLFQYLVYIRSKSMIELIFGIISILVVLGCFIYFKVVNKRLNTELAQIRSNLSRIQNAYNRVLDSIQYDFECFLDNKFNNLSCFDNLEKNELHDFVDALDSLNIDLNPVQKAFRHSSFLNINEDLNNTQVRIKAKEKCKEDFKVFKINAC